MAKNILVIALASLAPFSKSTRLRGIWQRREAVNAIPRHGRAEDQLAKGWATHQSMYIEQERLRSRGYGDGVVHGAISNLIHPTPIIMSFASRLFSRSQYNQNAFEPSLQSCRAFRVSGSSEFNGISEICQSLLQVSFVKLLTKSYGLVMWIACSYKPISLTPRV